MRDKLAYARCCRSASTTLLNDTGNLGCILIPQQFMQLVLKTTENYVERPFFRARGFFGIVLDLGHLLFLTFATLFCLSRKKWPALRHPCYPVTKPHETTARI
jgi:hypothetical protein